ncbi:glycine oxidase ThiO [Myxacorys almedinensis]|uniref:glycine oxidase n=1 Tax=Myxacorys almedinensis A TaxID=2690445 RepID=A0A8J8CJ80_9CYAN|nr:glycine oxidase ThiO [Myxacorys almedinensis]NDJ17331.1 glycine oxidase ThiO [Myxacorys almedinensis A]
MAEQRDILIVGGGVISVAIALELAHQGATVTILCRDAAQAATQAAAGMLAPQAERISPGPMLELCLQSRALYPSWIHRLETLTGLSAGYWACGILAPRYKPTKDPKSDWLGREELHALQPGLSAEVAGGYWYPKDAQVDNRALAKALWAAAPALGVEIQTGLMVDTIVHRNGVVTHLQTSLGDWQADHYIVATGAWSHDLLPIPVFPKKGQMFSVQVLSEAEQFALQNSAEVCTAGFRESLPLQHVLYGEDVYIVPRQDGRIVIGATSENVGFAAGNTAIGIESLRQAASRLYPALRQFPVQESWWGFRPATPDDLPILGESPYRNLTLAVGHYRNGILLAPATGRAIAQWVLCQSSPLPLDAFHWSRFSD